MIEIEKLKELPPPYEIYEFEPCKPAYFKIVGYEIGKIRIQPKWPGAPPEKWVVAIRLHVDPETKPYFPHYWDITPSRLVYQLIGMLTREIPEGMWLKVHRDVPGPKAHFSVQWVERPE
ncbi:hypothetical protein J7J18_02665 [bacterium]|nr:hypothetical protein [bacterium]